MPFNARSNGGAYNVDPNKFTDDDRIKKAPVEKVKHGGLISAITAIITLAALAAFFWFIVAI